MAGKRKAVVSRGNSGNVVCAGHGREVPGGLLYTLAAVEQSPGNRRKRLHHHRVLGVVPPVALDPGAGQRVADAPGRQVPAQLLEPAPVPLGGPEVLGLVAADALPPLHRQQPPHAEHEQPHRDDRACRGVAAGSLAPGLRGEAEVPGERLLRGDLEAHQCRNARPAPGCRSAPPASRCRCRSRTGRSPCRRPAPAARRCRRPLALPDVVQARAHRQLVARSARRRSRWPRSRRPPAARTAPGAAVRRSP